MRKPLFFFTNFETPFNCLTARGLVLSLFSLRSMPNLAFQVATVSFFTILSFIRKTFSTFKC